MTRYLLDTNIVLRLSNPLDIQYETSLRSAFDINLGIINIDRRSALG